MTSFGMGSAAHSSRVVGELDESLARNQLSDALRKVARGDQRAFNFVYANTRPKLATICRTITSDPQTVEDVLQEAYAIVWLKAGDFDPSRGSPISWLATIVKNRAIDEKRSISRRGTPAPLEVVDHIAEDTPLACELIEGREQSLTLASHLSGLNDKERKAIASAYFDDLTYQEVATRDGVPYGTMKSWIRRGLGKLKQAMIDG